MTADFEVIEVNMSEEDKVTLVERFVNTKLREASQFTFEEERKTGTRLEDALYYAILNEIVLEALIEHIERNKLDAENESE
jgi:hypothetical protein